MADYCCANMKSFTRARSELDPEILATMNARADDLPAALIRIDQTTHAYILGYAQIFYCPWCGDKLPEPLEPEVKIDISVDASGTIHWNGEPLHDEEELRTRLNNQMRPKSE